MEFSNKETDPAYAIAPGSKYNLPSFVLALGHHSRRVLKSLPVLLVLATVLIIAAMDFSSFYKMFVPGNVDLKDNIILVWYDVYCLFVFFVIPAFFTRFIFQDPLTVVGLNVPPKPIRAVFFTLLALAILIPYMIIFSQKTSFKDFYAVNGASFDKLLFINMVIFPPYYFCEEFFFRGFLFLYLFKKIRWHSFWVTDILFTLSHIGKPGLEVLLCIPVSVIFNCLTLACRSFYPAAAVHFTLGTLLFVMVNFHWLA